MSQERRTSRRTEVRAPFRWQRLSGRTLKDAIRSWGLEDVLLRQQRSAALDAEFEQAATRVADADVRAALRALKARLELLTQGSSSEWGARQVLELSADGIGFTSREALTTGELLAVHFALSSGFHVVAEAEVTHASACSGGQRVGASLLNLDASTSRALTQLIIR